MIRRLLVPTTFAIAALSLGLAGCNSTSRQSAGLQQVDDLLSRIERVHVETELSKARLRTAVESMHALVSPDFAGDPVQSYSGFVAALEASEKQAVALRRAVDPMKRVAEPFFVDWQMQLENFANPTMRERSQVRLNETRRRYNAIVAAVDPALAAYDSVNIGMSDCATFLGRDFNPSAVGMIRQDAHHVTGRAGRLDGLFDQCLEATRAYVEETGFATDLDQEPASEEPEVTETR